MAERQTVAGAYQKITAHEDICAVRYQALETTLGEVKRGQANHARIGLGILLALLGFMGKEVWDGRNDEPKAPASASAPAR